MPKDTTCNKKFSSAVGFASRLPFASEGWGLCQYTLTSHGEMLAT